MTNQPLLSKREKEILKLVATGLTNREIAQNLHISPNTVKVHLSNIFEKTNVTSRTEAAFYGIEHGIIEVPSNEIVNSNGINWEILLGKFRWVWVAVALLSIVILVTFVTNVLIPAPTPEVEIDERWQKLAALPEPRTGMAAVAYHDEIFVFGGEGKDGVSGKVFRYSPLGDVWERLNDKPTEVSDIQGVLMGEKVYVPGGRMANGKITNILEIYDPRQDIWEQGSPLPRNISSYALAAVEGKLFVFGGWDGTSVFDSVFIYDPALDSWHEGSSMRLPAYDLGAVALTEQIVIMGGRNADGALKTVWAYYPSRDFNGEEAWVEFMDFPESRFGFSTAGVYDAIYVLGGWIGQEDAVDERGLMMTNEEWIKFPANQTYYDRQPAMVSLGALLYILDPSPDLDETRLWTYQAFYYSIFIPYMP